MTELRVRMGAGSGATTSRRGCPTAWSASWARRTWTRPKIDQGFNQLLQRATEDWYTRSLIASAGIRPVGFDRPRR
jgi:hypothetical protein